jgi:hypothetical protein
MVSFLIILTSFISIILFDFLPVLKFVNSLFSSQKDFIIAITESNKKGKEKQKILIATFGKTLLETTKLFLFFFIAISPYIVLIFIGPFLKESINFYAILTSSKGVFISSIVFLLYYLLKKQFGRFGL